MEMKDIKVYECKICDWSFIGNAEMDECVMCGAEQDEEIIEN